MKHFLALLAISYAGAAACVWWLSSFLPRFLLPDLPFLAIVYAGVFVQGPAGFLAAIPPAVFREVTSSGPPWAIFLASMSLYFLGREIGMRLFLRTEFFILSVVAGLLALESVSVAILLRLSGSSSFSVLWMMQEAVRIAWTGLIAVPIYNDLSGRWRPVRE